MSHEHHHRDECHHADVHPKEGDKFCPGCKGTFPRTDVYWSLQREKKSKQCRICGETYQYYRYFPYAYCRRCQSKKQVQYRQVKRFLVDHPLSVVPQNPPCTSCDDKGRTKEYNGLYLCRDCDNFVHGAEWDRSKVSQYLVDVRDHIQRDRERQEYNANISEAQKARPHGYPFSHKLCLVYELKLTALYDLLTKKEESAYTP